MNDGEYAPVISVKCRNTNTYCSRVVIPGPCVLVYEYENPQSKCGATAWLESFSEPIPDKGYRYEEVIAKIPQNPKKSSKKFRSQPGKGFGRKGDRQRKAA